MKVRGVWHQQFRIFHWIQKGISFFDKTIDAFFPIFKSRGKINNTNVNLPTLAENARLGIKKTMC